MTAAENVQGEVPNVDIKKMTAAKNVRSEWLQQKMLRVKSQMWVSIV